MIILKYFWGHVKILKSNTTPIGMSTRKATSNTNFFFFNIISSDKLIEEAWFELFKVLESHLPPPKAKGLENYFNIEQEVIVDSWKEKRIWYKE